MAYLNQVTLTNGVPAAAADDGEVLTLNGICPRFVTVSMTVPTDAQDAGDVIAATQVVATCCPGNDIPTTLHSVTIIDTDDQKAALYLVFLDANTTLGTEDVAPDIDDTEALTLQGAPIDFAVADYKDLGGASYAGRNGLGMVLKPATGTDDVYMAIVLGGVAATYASGVITVRLGFI